MILVIVAQGYRIYQNYRVNQQQFISEVQSALDDAVEVYFADRAKNEVFILTMNDEDTLQELPHAAFSFTTHESQFDTTIHIQTDRGERIESYAYSYTTGDSNIIQSVRHLAGDTALIKKEVSFTHRSDTTLRWRGSTEDISTFVQKVMVSISGESIDLSRLYQLLRTELERRDLSIAIQLEYNRPGGMLISSSGEQSLPLSTISKSTFLSEDEFLSLRFENASRIILQKGIVDIVLSLVIIGVVFWVLTYLYRIIRNQKELALIKDDLISNITHEFKTPIATISTAIEGISAFNETNDKEKTKRYLGISSDQLVKLNTMVEKLLETATIDSGELDISKEDCEMVALTRQVAEQFQLNLKGKQLAIELPDVPCWYTVDPFHLENALSNLIDNALKYGGDQIKVQLTVSNGQPVWTVEDNGGYIEKVHRDKIFEKLYRIPKGNQHDVKGFGIGLYYTRAIVEKHGGSIRLEVEKNLTRFVITL